MLATILGRFSTRIRTKSEYLSSEWVTDGYWIDQRWLHGAIWGALVQAVPDECMALVEPTICKGFRPDIAIINNKHEKLAVIEYESSNSSDERLIAKDLRHFEQAILEYRQRDKYIDDPGWVLPKLWLLISTLPTCDVTRWPWHGYNKNKKYGPEIKDRRKRDSNPFDYYSASIHAACKTCWDSVSGTANIIDNETQIVWANIDQTHIRVMNINGDKQSDQDSLVFNLFAN